MCNNNILIWIINKIISNNNSINRTKAISTTLDKYDKPIVIKYSLSILYIYKTNEVYYFFYISVFNKQHVKTLTKANQFYRIVQIKEKLSLGRILLFNTRNKNYNNKWKEYSKMKICQLINQIL